MSEPSLFYRADELLAQQNLRPFERAAWVNPRTGRRDPRVVGEPPPLRWRVSQDLFDQAVDHVKRSGLGWIGGDRQMLFGLPIAVDEGLPPNSLLLEPSAD